MRIKRDATFDPDGSLVFPTNDGDFDIIVGILDGEGSFLEYAPDTTGGYHFAPKKQAAQWAQHDVDIGEDL